MKKIIFSSALLAAAFASAQYTGIGTTSPTDKLDVNGTIRARGILRQDGFDFVMGNGDQVTRGNSGPSRALVKSNIVTANGPVAQLALNWENDFPAGVKINGALQFPNVSAGSGASNLLFLDSQSMVHSLSGTAAGQILKWDGTIWTLASDNVGSYNASSSVLLNGTSFERAALTGDVTASQNSNVTTIADNAVTSAKIADGAVSTVDLADGSVTAGKLNQMAATSGQVLKWNGTQWAPAADTDTNSTYTGSTSVALNGTAFERSALTGDITAAQNSNVTTISNNAVTSAKIADGTIAAADLGSLGATAAGQNLTWNGTAWAATTPAPLTNLYNSNGQLTTERTVDQNGNLLNFTNGNIRIGGSLGTSGTAGFGGYDLSLGFTNQTERGDSGPSRALVKEGSAATGPYLVVNYGNDFTAGTRVDSKLFIQNTTGAPAANDQVLTVAENGEVKKPGL